MDRWIETDYSGISVWESAFIQYVEEYSHSRLAVLPTKYCLIFWVEMSCPPSLDTWLGNSTLNCCFFFNTHYSLAVQYQELLVTVISPMTSALSKQYSDTKLTFELFCFM